MSLILQLLWQLNADQYCFCLWKQKNNFPQVAVVNSDCRLKEKKKKVGGWWRWSWDKNWNFFSNEPGKIENVQMEVVVYFFQFFYFNFHFFILIFLFSFFFLVELTQPQIRKYSWHVTTRREKHNTWFINFKKIKKKKVYTHNNNRIQRRTCCLLIKFFFPIKKKEKRIQEQKALAKWEKNHGC